MGRTEDVGSRSTAALVPCCLPPRPLRHVDAGPLKQLFVFFFPTMNDLCGRAPAKWLTWGLTGARWWVVTIGPEFRKEENVLVLDRSSVLHILPVSFPAYCERIQRVSKFWTRLQDCARRGWIIDIHEDRHCAVQTSVLASARSWRALSGDLTWPGMKPHGNIGRKTVNSTGAWDLLAVRRQKPTTELQCF